MFVGVFYIKKIKILSNCESHKKFCFQKNQKNVCLCFKLLQNHDNRKKLHHSMHLNMHFVKKLQIGFPLFQRNIFNKKI